MLRVTYQNASDNLHKLQHLWDSVVGALLSEMLGKNVPASTTIPYSAKQPIYWQTPYASLLTEKRPDPLAHSFGLCATPRFSTLHDAFSYHASKHPLNIAVEHLGESITYAELDLLSSQLAKRLRARGVRPGTRVCLLVRRSIPMIVAIVAVLKAGGSYVPLDGGIVTDSTFSGILKESSPRIVLCSEKYVHRMDGRSVPAMCLEQTLEELRAAGDSSDSSLVLPDPARPSNEAYVIFTSGTTGKPKGVSVTHRNVTNLVCLSPGDLGIRPGMRVGQILNIAFDMCAWEILGCLTNGGTLVLRGTAAASWTAVLKSVDVLISTPSILLRHNPEDYPNIKVIATAGEPCPQSLADNWAKQAVFYNSCGPTEVTIINTVHRHRPGVPLTIGKPTPNNSVYVLDDDLQPVPEGQPGTLWAGGAGISNGYLNLPEITMKRYKPDPFNMRNGGGMMYNTGDLGRWTPDGMLEHLGRADDQVKVKGFRVELDGVAAAMNTCPGVTSSCALLIGDELWGFYESPGVDALPEEVKEATAKIQPYYAVPCKFMALPAVPLTSNGKTDKRMLRTLVEDLTVSASS